MKSFLSIIKYDYLQRTRSYAFLITLCATLAIAYTFVPEPNANYSTIRIADYLGYYNSAWFGYVTAIMTSIFLSLIGFYLVNSGIKTDVDTKVGQIVAATPVKNILYLIGKGTSNFMVLLTIAFLVFLMSILLFFLYNDGFSFELLQFVKPYLLITIPSLFFISALAVVFEVLMGKYTVVQNIVFFFLFASLAVNTPSQDSYFTMDVYGSKIVTQQMEKNVRAVSGTDRNTDLTIGYILGNIKGSKKFKFNGIDFPTQFILSRFLWMLFGVLLLVVVSPLFHRFDQKKWVSKKNSTEAIIPKEKNESVVILSALPNTETNYGILAFVRIEMLLLVRHGKKWLWLFNFAGMFLLAFLPLETAHQLVLPILWFLQVGRLSELNTKEITYGVHYFTFASYKPLSRLLLSQITVGIGLMFFLSIPILIRYMYLADFIAVFVILLGGITIVLLASLLGILTKGKKLFEVLFFMITYAIINGIIFMDYFGALPHNSWYTLKLILVCICLGIFSFFIRNHQLRR